MRRSATLTFTTLAAAAFAIAAGPAAAQSAGQPAGQTAAAPGGERINTIIVFGNDPCPASAGDEITVCARKAEAEASPIEAAAPEADLSGDEPRTPSWDVAAADAVLLDAARVESRRLAERVDDLSRRLGDAEAQLRSERALSEDRRSAIEEWAAAYAALEREIGEARRALSEARDGAALSAAASTAASAAAPPQPPPPPQAPPPPQTRAVTSGVLRRDTLATNQRSGPKTKPEPEPAEEERPLARRVRKLLSLL